MMAGRNERRQDEWNEIMKAGDRNERKNAGWKKRKKKVCRMVGKMAGSNKEDSRMYGRKARRQDG